MRIDQLLVQRQLASSRSQAQRLIADGLEFLHDGAWRRCSKNGEEVPEQAELRLISQAEARYVSRGGLKLEAGLRAMDWSVQDLQCLDVGQSTGGFTDCLLQAGARRVVGVDVGSGQLHPRLREDWRVVCIEKCNARNLSAAELTRGYLAALPAHSDVETAAVGAPFSPAFDLVVIDVSFISQTLLLPSLVPFFKPGGRLLSLVKPQFELQPGEVGKRGIVREPSLHAKVEKRLRDCCAMLGLSWLRWLDSPIAGGDGNREFLLAAQRPATAVA